MSNVSVSSINVGFVDNELYIIAIPSSGYGSTEVLHYNSGYNDQCNIEIIPQHILSSGQYVLSFVVINWGGPAALTATLTMSDGSTQPVNMPTNSSAGTGVVFTKNIPITVGG
ncbi:hypothetical protein [Rahnella sp. AA]|uniref:hypothetical protein n=1 Tax=Rahnella sp. AA TaxID=2057180 RepID=UPI0012FF1FFD|nr:hypothetical protein [Rahnella sp. AA]